MRNTEISLFKKNRHAEGTYPERYKNGILIAAYLIIGIFLVIGSDHMYSKVSNLEVVYAKADGAKDSVPAIVGAQMKLPDTGKYSDKMKNQIDQTVKETVKSVQKTQLVGEAKLKRDRNGTILLSEKELGVLHRIVEAEATMEDVKGRILVANVILNRVKEEEFPDTISEVVFQKVNGKTQFSPILDGRYWSVKVSDKTKEAVKRALKGEDYSDGALYFVARSMADKNNMTWFDKSLTRLFQHGVHEFYR